MGGYFALRVILNSPFIPPSGGYRVVLRNLRVFRSASVRNFKLYLVSRYDTYLRGERMRRRRYRATRGRKTTRGRRTRRRRY
uniref:Uncharacterized protein n=1 Tax=Pygoscelis antarcticus TaxID=79643 RepID=A0A7G7LKQ2_PYGAN|nr:hypothetical protein [Pygoscelis antarcticus]